MTDPTRPDPRPPRPPAAGDGLLDDLFHGCAVAAFVEQAAAEGGWPSPEATRRRAYRYYEDELAAKPRPVPG